MLVWISIFAIILTIILSYTYLKLLKNKYKYAKECVNWGCNHVGQICKPESEGADNKTWICDGASWHHAKDMKDMKDKYAKECNEWSCDQVGQICPPNVSGAEGRYWICDGETWHQVVKPY